MKKNVGILFSLMMLFALSACGNSAGLEAQGETSSLEAINAEKLQSTAQKDEVTSVISDQEEDMGANTLVVYFSATGTTETVAENAAEILGAELYEITPEAPYTDADLTYYTDGRADREQNDPAARPAISGKVENMDSYDTILLGYPIWHGQAPRIINTFLESYDFAGKTILPFCTSGSSGLGSSDTNLHSLCPDTAWKNGERFPANASKADVEAWLKTSGIAAKPAVNDIAFNFETKTVTLNSGYQMPINGLGTYRLNDEECVNSVTAALNSGVRLIDTAQAYGNEESVGEAVRNSGVPREDIFVIPGSSNPEHIQENTELYDFELTKDEMARINALDRNEKHDWY